MIETIFTYLTYYIAFYLELINLKNLTKNKYKFKIIHLLYILVIAILNYYLTKYVLIKMIFSFVGLIFMSHKMLKIDGKKSVVVSSIYYILIVLIEYLFSIIVVDVLKYNPNNYLISVSIQKNILGNLLSVITYIICRIKLFNILYEKLNNIFAQDDNRIMYLLFIDFTIIIMERIYMVNIVGKLALIYSILYIVIFIIFAIYTILSLYKVYYLNNFNIYLKEKDENTQKILEEYKIFKHNINNNLLAIKSVGSKKVKLMIDDFLNNYSIKSENVSNVSSLPESLRTIMYQKILENMNLDLKIHIDSFISTDPIKELNISKYRRFVESIGILIDNAIEAIKENNDGYIYVYASETCETYNIKIINPISNYINVDQIGEKGASSKKEPSGYGLYYVRGIKGIKTSISVKNDKFISSIEIKK